MMEYSVKHFRTEHYIPFHLKTENKYLRCHSNEDVDNWRVVVNGGREGEVGKHSFHLFASVTCILFEHVGKSIDIQPYNVIVIAVDLIDNCWEFAIPWISWSYSQWLWHHYIRWNKPRTSTTTTKRRKNKNRNSSTHHINTFNTFTTNIDLINKTFRWVSQRNDNCISQK